MRTLIKAFVLPTLFLVGFNLQVSAQHQQNHNTKGKSVKKSQPKKVIKSAHVVYKKPTRKVVSVRTLPTRTVIVHRGHNYYYANNNYYTQSRGHYIRIAPMVGFRINILPSNYRKVRYNNHDYYNANGVFYRQIDTEYEVINPEIGTIIYELPNDYEKVDIDGITYYEYANVLYEKIQIDGTRAYEVVGIIETE